MPNIFFVRDGTGDHHTSQGQCIAMSAVAGLASRYSARFSQSGPFINNGVASPFAAYRHVVMEVGDSETTAEYPKPGYYYFVGLRPQEAKVLLEVDPQ